MHRLRAISDVLADTDRQLATGESAMRVWHTGFPVLDHYLSGGVRGGELALLGGPQGLGKTALVLQLLRNTVTEGNVGVYFSYEHDAHTLLQRLVALEAAEVAGLDAPPLREIRAVMEDVKGTGVGTLAERLARIGADEALRRVAAYGDRLLIHRSTGATGLDEIRKVALETAERTGDSPLLAVDYLQKVAVNDFDGTEMELVTRIVEGLKDLALDLNVPVLSVVAAEKEGLVTGKRLRVHHLRGSSALAYEPDIVLIMNEKFDVVARQHLVYDITKAERFHNWVVISIEKNRSGVDKVDVEFRKMFEHGLFDAAGGQLVAEQLVDERIFVE